MKKNIFLAFSVLAVFIHQPMFSVVEFEGRTLTEGEAKSEVKSLTEQSKILEKNLKEREQVLETERSEATASRGKFLKSEQIGQLTSEERVRFFESASQTQETEASTQQVRDEIQSIDENKKELTSQLATTYEPPSQPQQEVPISKSRVA